MFSISQHLEASLIQTSLAKGAQKMPKKVIRSDNIEAEELDKIPLEKLELTQAERIIKKFGGPGRLASILEQIGRSKHRSSIYKWVYPREKGGTGGLVPTAAWPDVFAAARFEGVLITAEDIDPRPQLIKQKRKSPEPRDKK